MCVYVTTPLLPLVQLSYSSQSFPHAAFSILMHPCVTCPVGSLNVYVNVFVAAVYVKLVVVLLLVFSASSTSSFIFNANVYSLWYICMLCVVSAGGALVLAFRNPEDRR